MYRYDISGVWHWGLDCTLLGKSYFSSRFFLGLGSGAVRFMSERAFPPPWTYCLLLAKKKAYRSRSPECRSAAAT